MKEKAYTSLICKNFCVYYKEGKEREICGGYFYLMHNMTSSEIGELINLLNLNLYKGCDEASFVCEKCQFKEDGCDFFIDKSATPCGGYLIIGRLLNRINF